MRRRHRHHALIFVGTLWCLFVPRFHSSCQGRRRPPHERKSVNLAHLGRIDLCCTFSTQSHQVPEGPCSERDRHTSNNKIGKNTPRALEYLRHPGSEGLKYMFTTFGCPWDTLKYN